jgi:hypothetical protein
MTTVLDRARNAQLFIISLQQRIEAAEQQSKSREWPYTSLSDEVRIVAQQLIDANRSALATATGTIGIELVDRMPAVNEAYAEATTVMFERNARARGVSLAAFTEATFATFDCLVHNAGQVLARAEGCIGGELNIHGLRIPHGPLWDK